MPRIAPADITGLVLAGGRGARMGGTDKGLLPWHGVPLALHALRRLAPQVGAVMISANRNPQAYAAFGAPVWPDPLPDHAGPLAGVLAGLTHCQTPWLLTVLCDAPRFPTDLAARLIAGLHDDPSSPADLAVAYAADDADTPRMQPVFCLLPLRLRSDLAHYLDQGGRAAGAWLGRHRVAAVHFDLPQDDPQAFANVNTATALAALQQQPAGALAPAPGARPAHPRP